MPDKEAPVTFQQSPYQLTNDMYFAIYIPDAVTPEQELLCWNRANNQLLQSNTELGIYDTILRKEDGLFFHSASSSARFMSLSFRWKSSAIQCIAVIMFVKTWRVLGEIQLSSLANLL